MFVHILVVGGEVLIWKEADISASVALPVFAVVNTVLAVGLTVGWATMMGHTSPKHRAKRALLTQELGTVYFGEPGPSTSLRTGRPAGEEA
jgi:hypothetical protein